MTKDNDRTPADPGRRDAMKCMAWAGAGVLWTVGGGVASSVLATAADAATRKAGSLDFVQISDTHIGFDKAANPDTLGTLREAIGKIAAMPVKPSFIIHTGDLTHLSKADEFDTVDQMLKGLNLPVFYTPGEHDTLDEGAGKLFLERFGKGTWGTGYRSFDMAGVHFIGLVNVVNLNPDGRGRLGDEQIAWLARDVAHLSASTAPPSSSMPTCRCSTPMSLGAGARWTRRRPWRRSGASAR
jgi:Icc protein